VTVQWRGGQRDVVLGDCADCRFINTYYQWKKTTNRRCFHVSSLQYTIKYLIAIIGWSRLQLRKLQPAHRWHACMRFGAFIIRICDVRRMTGAVEWRPKTFLVVLPTANHWRIRETGLECALSGGRKFRRPVTVVYGEFLRPKWVCSGYYFIIVLSRYSGSARESQKTDRVTCSRMFYVTISKRPSSASYRHDRSLIT